MSPEICIVVVIRISLSDLGEVKADTVDPVEGISPRSAMAMDSGHHRGLGAGHAFTGATRELGRADCLLS